MEEGEKVTTRYFGTFSIIMWILFSKIDLECFFKKEYDLEYRSNEFSQLIIF